jgi:hypothetical protein
LMGIVGLSASNLATKKGILHTQTFWQLTRQSLPVRLALRGRQLAPHHGVQVWTTSLYRVSKDSVRCAAAQRHSWSMVAFLHRHPA